MASVLKIKRSSVQGKAPTTSDITTGEIALNTRDGKLFSSDGSSVFEVGANLHSLSVGTGGISVANGAFSLPTSDGTSGQVISTNGAGTLSFIDLSTAQGGGFSTSTTNQFPTGDYGDLSQAAGTDAFGVAIDSLFDCMEPVGRLDVTDLGNSEAYVGA